MNHSLLKAREIEALAFINGAPAILNPAGRNRWAQRLGTAWESLRKRMARSAALDSAVDWSARGL
jgi:hypothetical protein